jgi:hypothetical protein
VSRERGQVVLSAAVVVAVALTAMAFAYLGLAYAGDVDREAAAPDGTDAVRALERAFENATRPAAGTHAWDDRDVALTRVTARLDARTASVADAAAARGVAYDFERNDTAAGSVAGEDCPGGMNREFGDCRAVDGVVIQERANETAVIAAAYDVRVVADGAETRLTVVVER